MQMALGVCLRNCCQLLFPGVIMNIDLLLVFENYCQLLFSEAINENGSKSAF